MMQCMHVCLRCSKNAIFILCINSLYISLSDTILTPKISLALSPLSKQFGAFHHITIKRNVRMHFLSFHVDMAPHLSSILSRIADGT